MAAFVGAMKAGCGLVSSARSVWSLLRQSAVICCQQPYYQRQRQPNGICCQHLCNQRKRQLSTTSNNDGGRIHASPFPPVHIPDNVSLTYHVMENFSKYGDLVALVDGASGKYYTYNETLTHVSRVGSAVAKLGIGHGDRTIMLSPNCLEFPIMYLALTSTGATVIPVNPAYTPGEIAHVIGLVQPKLIVTVASLVNNVRAAMSQAGCVKEIIVLDTADGCRPFASLMDDDGTAFTENLDIDTRDHVATLLFSSGTTGPPKGAMMTHHSIIANIQQMNTPEILAVAPGEQSYIAYLPFYHVFGLVVIMLNGLRQGTKLVILPRFEPEPFLKHVQDHKVEVVFLIPPLMVFLAKSPMTDQYDLASMKDVLVGAAPVGAHISEEFIDKFQIEQLRQGFGMTETSGATHLNPRGRWKIGSVGTPVSNTETKIINIETGHLQPIGEKGELCIRGPQIMKGYWQSPQATSDTLDNEGWLHTGDIAQCDEDEYVYIVDRRKDLIKYKGFQVSPSELENLLLKHPAVGDVGVVGVPHEAVGELPRAYVVLRPGRRATEQDLLDYVSENMADYKHLRGGVEIRTEIPKLATGKILKRELLREYLDNK